MVLQCVISQMLTPFREHDPIHLTLCASPQQLNMLVHLGEFGSESADRPLEIGVAINERLLLSKVPDTRSPVLQVDEPQVRPLPNQKFDSPAMQPCCFRFRAQ